MGDPDDGWSAELDEALDRYLNPDDYTDDEEKPDDDHR